MYKEINELLKLTSNIENETKPLWGTMTSQKMIEHLVNTFRVSSGKIYIQCFSQAEKLPILKKILMSDRPMPRGFDSPANKVLPQKYEFENLDTAIENLRKEVKDYYKYFEENPYAKTVNPTFGELEKSEWEQFHKKHLTHHFTQFGLIE